ncbi:BnaC06g00680D [Brassica napus]|uniref:BnaC06g00680D protein n=1 Tax=Brassica napus TaxID=3708 RepID=A0A078FHV3_BRANA|nr:BnaC06g00680D [Brassica napus]
MTANKRLRSKLIIPEFIEFISPCSSYALSIVLIGVADGRWEDMRKFDDKIPKREFDNFQFLNFTEIMKRDHQTTELSFLGKTTGVAKKINLRPPPTPYTPTIRTELPSPAPDEHTQNCPICLTNRLVEIADPGYQTVPSAEY